jgi:hypothetical protein
MLISKMQTSLCGNIPPKKFNFAKFHFVRLILYCNFSFGWVGHLSLRQVYIFEISIKFSIFFKPNMTYFQDYNFYQGHF